jgi:hypothetical protein
MNGASLMTALRSNLILPSTPGSLGPYSACFDFSTFRLFRPHPIGAIGEICGFSSFLQKKVRKTANRLCDFAGICGLLHDFAAPLFSAIIHNPRTRKPPWQALTAYRPFRRIAPTFAFHPSCSIARRSAAFSNTSSRNTPSYPISCNASRQSSHGSVP